MLMHERENCKSWLKIATIDRRIRKLYAFEFFLTCYVKKKELSLVFAAVKCEFEINKVEGMGKISRTHSTKSAPALSSDMVREYIQ